MRIKFERFGGFTGIGIKSEIDTEQLDDGTARELVELVENSGFFDLLEDRLVGGPGTDQFQIRLEIEDAGRSRTLQIDDESGVPELAGLVRRLTLLSRSVG